MSFFKEFRDKQIKKLAYFRYLARGCRHGSDKEDYYVEAKFWFIKLFLNLFKKNFIFILQLLTMIVLIMQVTAEHIDFISLNRPFVKIEPLYFGTLSSEKGEDPSQVWCELIYKIKNFGPIPAYSVRFAKGGLKISSEVRGEFKEDAIPGLRELKVNWLAPNSEQDFHRGIIYTDAKSSVEAYKNGLPLKIMFKITYNGPKFMWFERSYWYQCEAQYQSNKITILNISGN